MHARFKLHAVSSALLAVALACVAPPTHAVDYRSVSTPAILFDSPSVQGKRLFVIASGTPVELIVSLDKWCKVRDSAGTISWIERKALTEKRTVQITAERAAIRKAPDDKAATEFEAVRDVVLDIVEVLRSGWIKVKHRDGATGYVHVSQVWGV
ncbi:MAG: hypothetical protein KDH16_18590 [Rhodocyclaceae bacterium]|nr:hypothetical protein [Rhodocyclaceae bacterium]MCP5311595.1 hypothetical protein [Zoogloeaceae bacterium]